MHTPGSNTHRWVLKLAWFDPNVQTLVTKYARTHAHIHTRTHTHAHTHTHMHARTYTHTVALST